MHAWRAAGASAHLCWRHGPTPSLNVPKPQGFGWAIAKALAEAGAEISLGVWVSAAYLECSCTCG